MTQVLFLLERDSANEVWAVFPETKYVRHTAGSPTTIYECYSPIGQHTECSLDYMVQCKIASPVEYESLKIELQHLGYNLMPLI